MVFRLAEIYKALMLRNERAILDFVGKEKMRRKFPDPALAVSATERFIAVRELQGRQYSGTLSRKTQVTESDHSNHQAEQILPFLAEHE